jgi:hypothetical protein
VTWLDTEPSFPTIIRQQFRRMAVRARRRPFVTAGVFVAIATGTFAVQARRPAMYEAEVRLLISEGAFAEDGRPRPRGELRAFVNRALFTPADLDPLIERHDLVRKLCAGSMAGARSRVRKLIEINTGFNYFEGYRNHSDPPRSARVEVAFSAPDPDLALAVVRDLGEIVAETQTARMAAVADARVEDLRLVAESAAGRAISLEKQLDRAKELAKEQPSPISDGTVEQLMTEVAAARTAAERAEGALVDAQLRTRTDHQTGALVHVVNPGLSAWGSISRVERVVRHALVSIVVAAVATLILVGVSDPAVLDETDLQRAGLRAVGRLAIRRGKSPRAEVQSHRGVASRAHSV